MVLWITQSAILINLILTINSQSSFPNTTTSTKRVSAATIIGDFKIGFLVSVRLYTPVKKHTRNLECGKIREHYGIQRVEVIFQTIDKINQNQDLLRNITLGVEIRDTCWYAPIALQQTIELIRESITPFSGKKTTNAHKIEQCSRSSLAHGIHEDSPLIGIAGPASSSIALQVQNLLQLFSIPQIGYSTTSKDLSDKMRFNTFMRVVPSDYYQAQVMIDIVKFNNWTYISTVHTDENYGQSGIQAFRELADQNGICIAREDSILSNDDEEKYIELMDNLEKDDNANVIVCFCEGMTVRGILKAIKRLNLTNRFLIIGSDGWADRQDVVADYEAQAVGSISIRIHSPYLKSFDDYYFSLDPFENHRNPWFKEFWEDKFQCKMPLERVTTTTTRTTTESSSTSSDFFETLTTEDFDNYTDYTTVSQEPMTTQTPFCTGYEDNTKNHRQEPKLSFLVKAIYTMAFGLQAYHDDVCGKDFIGVCPKLEKSFNHTIFFNYLMNVSFVTDERDNVDFNQDGDVLAHYDIMNFQHVNGSFAYVKIGDWHNHTLYFSDELKTPNGTLKFLSVCSKPCSAGYYKVTKSNQILSIFQETGDAIQSYCCWMCVACENNQYLKNETYCEDCPLGSWPNKQQTVCVINPIEIMEWSNIESVISTAFSILGTTLSGIVLIIFIHYNNTPVVKASTRELCYIVLVGMILSHLSIFFILAHPTVEMCALSRVLPGISFSMIYGSLLIKTNRIARLLAISKKRFPSKNLKFMSPLSQVILAVLLISIECFIAIGILYKEPPETELRYPRENQNLLVCKESTETIIVPLAFIFLLIFLCTWFAFKTRNVPENFNETKFVGFAIYTTCVIWIAFFPIYYGSEMQIITKCLCISLSSIMTLTFMFLPKIYIILLHPEKNIRALFTTSKSIRCHIGATRHTNLSHKTSSSISEYGAPTSEFEPTFQRSFKKSSSSQTSTEKLNVERNDKSCSPITDEVFECFLTEKSDTLLNSSPQDPYYVVAKNSEYMRVPTSPNHGKLKNNKIYMKEKYLNGNLYIHPSMNPTRKLHHHKPKRRVESPKPVLCVECLEMEKRNVKILPNVINKQIVTIKKKSPIFTVERIPFESNETSHTTDDQRRIAISEESLSECSISDTACELKRITIKLK
ncbi:CLUMA_CG017895, isoform A [Clunio marinus]|uniref:CLUMA_CG017895, isoform A n=1 Tax=Clunio marinus TaxID=568069 RepID=A0A1J1IYS9_9DIPT|nr:CLUMA_CG017895, isoform A [Clunio marinus]